MRVYKLTIEPLSSFRTALQSDTIFGHLMWALRYVESEDALIQFLDRYRAGEPPLLVSSGFPEGTLPVPVLHPSATASLPSFPRGMEYLPLRRWRELAGGLSIEALIQDSQVAHDDQQHPGRSRITHSVTRTSVDRATGGAREAQLFVTEEIFHESGYRLDVWHKLADESLLPRLGRWWHWIEKNGFGRRKSAGHGAFHIVEPLHPAASDLPHVAHPNGFVALSAWVPRQTDPTDVTYQTRVKRGKLAEALARPNPWKKPLLMLKPGSVAHLATGESMREWYGGLVENVHWTREDIVQYGYALPVGVNLLRHGKA